MGKRGPKPKPSELRRLEGDPGRLGVPEDEVKPFGRPVKPSWLSKDAKDVWDRIVKAMPDDLYTTADTDVLAAYCEAAGLHARATRELAKQRLVSAAGKRNPLALIQGEAARRMATLGTRLGLSPADRRGLSADQKRKGSKWDGLLQ